MDLEVLQLWNMSLEFQQTLSLHMSWYEIISCYLRKHFAKPSVNVFELHKVLKHWSWEIFCHILYPSTLSIESIVSKTNKWIKYIGNIIVTSWQKQTFPHFLGFKICRLTNLIWFETVDRMYWEAKILKWSVGSIAYLGLHLKKNPICLLSFLTCVTIFTIKINSSATLKKNRSRAELTGFTRRMFVLLKLELGPPGNPANSTAAFGRLDGWRPQWRKNPTNILNNSHFFNYIFFFYFFLRSIKNLQHNW